MLIEFHVAGVPAPKGSARAMVRGGRAVFVPGSSSVNQERQRAWTSAVTIEAMRAMDGRPPIAGPVAVRITYRFARPRSHYNARGALKPSAPRVHTVKPDRDKLDRSTLDAMTGVAYVDDAQAWRGCSVKIYCEAGETPGATIEVAAQEDQ